MKEFKKFTVSLGSQLAQANVPWKSGGAAWSGLAPLIINPPTKEQEQAKLAEDELIRLFAEKFDKYFTDPKRRLEATKYTNEMVTEKAAELVVYNRRNNLPELDPEDSESWMSQIFDGEFYQTEAFVQPYGSISYDRYDRHTLAAFLVDKVFPHMGASTKIETQQQEKMYGESLSVIQSIAAHSYRIYSRMSNVAFDGVSVQPVMYMRNDGRSITGAVLIYQALKQEDGKNTMQTIISLVWWDAAFIAEPIGDMPKAQLH